MAIRCNLSTLMGQNRYTIQDIYEKTGLSRGTISSLYHDNVQRFDCETLSKLCELFDCEVGNLLEYYKPKNQEY
jgi:putative transcriptional regulator